MSFDVMHELRKIGQSYPQKAPPIPLVFSQTGVLGYVGGRRGVYLNSGTRHLVEAMLRDEARAERAAREVSNGLLGAGELLPVIRMGSDRMDAIRAIQSMRGAITSWNDVINARTSG